MNQQPICFQSALAPRNRECAYYEDIPNVATEHSSQALPKNNAMLNEICSLLGNLELQLLDLHDFYQGVQL